MTTDSGATEGRATTPGTAPHPAGHAADSAPDPDGGAGAPEVEGVLDVLQHQVAVFARRAEQTRLGGVGQARNSMDRAAYLLLNRLDKQGPMGVKALAAGMGIDSSTVTRQVAPLVDAGLVSRTSHPEDGRAVVLSLSERGMSRLEEVRSSRRELMGLLTAEWNEEDRDAFCALLTRFNSALLGIQPGGGPGESA
ncbi:MarR family transcriptional regulator [Streptomyces sp. HNM0574]|uniref:MarR family winged helix-turn-helix transcriptional regulator n=1 Tax=Streptomyces sp. HNM0574 TaxID=2714954 RepID=UPI001F108FA7|nr:MarR family transcriptional regulator [Streptomyces sp. HNM0574]